MATTTAKLALRKPDPTDNVNVTTDISDNMQKIDDGFAGIQPAFRNVIRNGDMGVAQRGNGNFTTSGYGIDGWNAQFSGGTYTTFRFAAGLNTDYGINGAKWAYGANTAGQAAAGDYSLIYQAIEDVRTFAGKQVTLSFVAAASTGTPKIGIEIEQKMGAGGAPSANVQTTVGSVTISTTATRYTVTFTVPSLSGKTLGTSGNDNLQLNFWTSAGSTFASRASSIGIQNANIGITDIQLEAGAVATAFERLPQQVQLAWCQRYFWRRTYAANDTGIAVVSTYNSTTSYFQFLCPVQMRAVPTGGFSAANQFNLFANGGTATSTNVSVVASATSQHSIEVTFNHPSATVGGSFVRSNGTNTYLEASAEL